ncbi:hypothetical protein SCHPADRAFT_530057 [Schizopora paradoxa]|uniref:Uncharacterized protein n=1 Tax=Schizopora paradoxa TaxID=27342 RepID=A0A0H2RF47_9AGAM|nr:hypothetical protein SCHPADRAFT_530057 [Schizopora paradoxa]
MQTTTNSARQAIAAALDCFSDENKLVGDFPWSQDWVARLVDDKSDFDELKKNLQNIEAVEEQLQQMLTSVSDASRMLREKFITRANRGGFRNLPDEILAMILEEALGDSKYQWNTNYYANNYCLVSRQFRRVALSVPSFWSRIASPPSGVSKAMLFASRTVTPTISLSINGVSPNIIDTRATELVRVVGMYKFVVSVSARIQRLSLQFFEEDRSHLAQTFKLRAHLPMPSLTELKITCSNVILGRIIRSICLNWDMPSLQKLTIKDVLPDLPTSVLLQIRTLSLEVNRGTAPAMFHAEGGWLTQEFVKFLLSFPSVEHLRVAVQLYDGYEQTQADEDPVMESVRTLDLGLQNTEAASAANILRIINFPAVDSFRVELGMKSLEVLEGVLDNVYFRAPPTSITNVTVAVVRELEDDDSTSPVYTIGKWCEQFGDVKSLRLESKKDDAHGLFAFTNPFDVLDIVDERGSIMNGKAVEEIPSQWSRGPRKVIYHLEDTAKHVDEYTSNTDSVFDF